MLSISPFMFLIGVHNLDTGINIINLENTLNISLYDSGMMFEFSGYELYKIGFLMIYLSFVFIYIGLFALIWQLKKL
jgi:hypothetical protein